MRYLLTLFAFVLLLSFQGVSAQALYNLPLPNHIRIAAVGDIMLGTNYPHAGHLPPHDGRYMLDSVKSYLQKADISFGNLEGAYHNGTGPTTKNCKDTLKCYAFRSPEHYMGYVAEAGFDLVSLANNHSGDFGMPARIRAMELADSFGMTFAGLEQCPFAVMEKDGIKYGFVAFAPNNGCVPLNDLKNAVALVDHLDSLCDIIIVSFHGGAEGSKHQHVPIGPENFLGENRGNLRVFSHTLIDHGADLILGHGPHVTRGIELYKDRLIAYSLGNFATYSRFNLLGPNGVCPILLVDIDSAGVFKSGQLIPVKQIGEGVPVIDEEKTVIGLVQELSKGDFPYSLLEISDDGLIRRKE